MAANEFVRVAETAAVPAGQARSFVVGNYDVAVFHIDGEFFALENLCPHQGGPIADGFIEGGVVTCPWHAWCFEVRTGKMTLGDFASIRRFPVKVEGTHLLLATEPIDERE